MADNRSSAPPAYEGPLIRPVTTTDNATGHAGSRSFPITAGVHLTQAGQLGDMGARCLRIATRSLLAATLAQVDGGELGTP